MWKLGIFSGLLVVSCLAAPQTDARNADDARVDGLIDSVFNPYLEGGGLTTKAPEPGSLGDLINRAVKEQQSKVTSNEGTILGVNNHVPKPDDCECVPYYQCQINGTIVDNGIGLIDIRSVYAVYKNRRS